MGYRDGSISMLKQSLPSLLSSLRLNPNLPLRSWYLIAGATLSTLNRPDAIAHVFQYAIEKDKDTGTNESETSIARRMREALVKTAPIAGLPKSINALLALKEVTPESLLDHPLEYSPTKRSVDLYDVPTSKVLQRGQHFFNRVYGKVSNRVMSRMDRSGTEDLGLTVRLLYGFILSNANVLSPVETSSVLIAGLIPQDVRSNALRV
ncbi:MAG: hypothetical protein Q9206_003612 [Seirophora lacunosa]